MVKKIMIVGLLVVVGMLVVHARHDTRRDAQAAREINQLQRLVDGAIEQVNDQADQIAILETAVKDLGGSNGAQ